MYARLRFRPLSTEAKPVSRRDRSDKNCERCHGLMVVDQLYDRSETLVSPCYRCVNCGELVDSLILQHRQHRPEPRREIDLPMFDLETWRLRVIARTRKPED